MLRTEFEGHVVGREPMTGHVGKSGAMLERVQLDDGRHLVLKRLEPETDFVMALTGDAVGREHLLWTSGLLDRLPPGVGHSVVDSWSGERETVLLMRDLGRAVLTWNDRLDVTRSRWMLTRVASLHDAFVGLDPADVPPGALTDLGDLIGLFQPARLAAHQSVGNDLVPLALRGWEYFVDLVPPDVADLVTGLLDDTGPLVRALRRCPLTLAHGDLATVNMAIEDDQLTLLDWSMPALAPGAVDIARFLAGCSPVVALSREEVLDTYRAACGPSYDEQAMKLALIGALVWLGWNKALDVVEHPDEGKRARERDDLAWWTARARESAETADW